MFDPLNKNVTDALDACRTQLEAGISLHETLDHCALLCRGQIGRFFVDASKLTARGENIRDVLQPLAPVLSEAERAILVAGWTAGRMEETLSIVVKQRESWHAARRRIIGRIAYPLLSVFVAALVAPLPGLVAGSYGVPIYCGLASLPFLFFGALIFGGYAAFQNRARATLTSAQTGVPLGAGFLDRLLLGTPLIRRAEVQGNLAEFSTLMSNLLAAGTPINEAFSICARALKNGRYRESMLRLKERTSRGEGLTESLREEPAALYPFEFVGAVAVGEKSGSLDAALARAGNQAREAYLRFIERVAENVPRAIYVLVALFIIVNIFYIFMNFYIRPMNDLLKGIPFLVP